MQIRDGGYSVIGRAHYLAVTLREYLWRDEFSHFILPMKNSRALERALSLWSLTDDKKGMNYALDLAKNIYIFFLYISTIQ
jgi:hypothetical protein